MFKLVRQPDRVRNSRQAIVQAASRHEGSAEWLHLLLETRFTIDVRGPLKLLDSGPSPATKAGEPGTSRS